MKEWKRLTNPEVDALDRRLPVLIPIGLIEAHGPHLSLSVDIDTAEYFSRAIAERTGAILAPGLPYGFADEMREYPGTIGLKPSTFTTVIAELGSMFCFHGFRTLIFVSGHGANKAPAEAAFWTIWETYPEAKLACWNWWTEAGLTGIHHADKGETEVAAVTGAVYHPERAVDFRIAKPWYMLRSRFALNPASGGINGEPSKADLAAGRAARDKVVEVLSDKVARIMREDGLEPQPDTGERG
jgi:creatinine amidohydrolase